MPYFARMLAQRHGFRVTLLLPVNRATGDVDAGTSDNIPGLDALDTADLIVLFMRFQELPDDQMKHFADYVASGRPIVALRTSTHAFAFQKRMDSPYARFDYRSKEWPGGFGRQVLGETWINHYGVHQKESTRGLPAPGKEGHPILQGVKDVWGESDVYAITTLAGDSDPVLMGQVLAGMKPDSPPNPDKKLTPVAWTKSYAGSTGRTARVFTTTMGHPADFSNQGFRRLLVNGCYWALGMEKRIRPDSNVDFLAPYTPAAIGFGKHRAGIKLDSLR